MNWKNFFICGLTGWCMEIIFTSLGCVATGDLRLIGQTSIWMFPIYGAAMLVEPLYSKINKLPTLCRSFIYSIGILIVEYITGSFLRLLSACPWDYSNATYHINGIIRLDYLPYWMAAGLVFERIICRQGTQNKENTFLKKRQQ